jgi:hypothetical protein
MILKWDIYTASPIPSFHYQLHNDLSMMYSIRELVY